MTSPSFTDFSADLERVRRLLHLVSMFRDFGASGIPSQLAANPSDWQQAVSLHGEASSVRTDLPLMAGAILLYAVGRFEYFVRQCVEGVVDGLTAKVASFSQLPNNLQKAYKEQTLTIAQSPRKYDYDEVRVDTILAQLVSCKQGANPVTVSAEVVSITESNMRPEILSELLKRVGITDFWRTVGKQLPVQILLSESDEGGCSKAAQSRLTDLMNLRNQIAHPTGSTTFPSPEDVARELDLLEAVSQVVDDVAAMAISSFAP